MARKAVIPGTQKTSTILDNVLSKLDIPDSKFSGSVIPISEIIPAYIEAKLTVPDFSFEIFCPQYGCKPASLIQYLYRHPEIDESLLKESRKRYHSWAVLVDAALVKQALKGDPRAIELFYKRFEGWCLPGEAGQKIIIMINPQLSMDGKDGHLEVRKTKAQAISGSVEEIDVISTKSPEVIDIKED